MSILNDIQTINQSHTNAEDKFTQIREYLLSNQLIYLYEFLMAPGIDTYENARQWFDDYYIQDENEGPEMAADIETELQNEAFNDRDYYWVSGNLAYGYQNTPISFEPVENIDLQNAINELIEKLKNPRYRNYGGC